MIKGLPDKLRSLRINYHFSQKEVASMLHVSPSIISGYETGERTPSAENLLALSYLYKCSVDYLLGKTIKEPSAMVDLTGLSEPQIHVLLELVKVMKNG